ncbi:hypothetical protein BGX38DRAFT_262549 [Terfezia claveryi]|nr:hypothetical protein BGX38DRAFT_262549 [Terfezia claveryi]
MSNPPDLDYESIWQQLWSRPRFRRTADSMHLQLTIHIQQYNSGNSGAVAVAPEMPINERNQIQQRTLINEINRIQREIRPAIRPWLAYGLGLALAVYLHVKFLANTNFELKNITKPGTLLACFTWSLLAGLVVNSEVKRSATYYVLRTLEFIKELVAERETLPMETVKEMLGWKWYWVNWRRSPGI